MVQQETRLAIPRSDRPRHWPAASGLGRVYPHVHPRLADSQGQDTTAASLSNKVPTGSTARRVKPALTAPSSVFHPHISSEAKRGRQLPDTRYPALHQLASSNKNLRASLHFNRGENQRCWEYHVSLQTTTLRFISLRPGCWLRACWLVNSLFRSSRPPHCGQCGSSALPSSV